MVKIAPSILSADFSTLAEDVIEVHSAGADLLHIDVMDGHFVPNITIGPVVIKSLADKVDIPFDVHLMISEPDRYIDAFADSGADIITVHQEACIHLHRVIQNIHDRNIKAGVALNPSTPLVTIENVLEDLDMVLIMSVNPGFGGQSFISSQVDKVAELKEMLRERGLEDKVEIEVDGGIKPETAPLMVEAGADILVAGSYLFNGEGKLIDRMQALRQATILNEE